MSILVVERSSDKEHFLDQKNNLKPEINPESNIFREKIHSMQEKNVKKKVKVPKQSENLKEGSKESIKNKRKVFSFDNFKVPTSSPNLKIPNNFEVNDFHLPGIKTHNSEPKKCLIKFTNSEKSLKLPRIESEESNLKSKLMIHDFKSTKSTNMEREKFLEMLEIFESKLIDISDKTKLPKKPKKLKIKDKNKNKDHEKIESPES